MSLPAPDITSGITVVLVGQFAGQTKTSLAQAILNACGNLSAALQDQQDGNGNAVPETTGEDALSAALAQSGDFQTQLQAWVTAWGGQ